MKSIVAMLRRVQQHTSYQHIPVDEISIRSLLWGSLKSKAQVAYVYARGRDIKGLLIGGITSYPWNSHMFFATDDLFVAEHGGAHLLRRFLRWVKHKPVQEIVLGESAGVKIASGLYQAMGFELAGGIYRRKV